MIRTMKKHIPVLIVLAVVLKMSLYYHLMDITVNFGVMTLLSVLYIGLIYNVLARRKKCFLGVNIVISLLLFADVIYFKYFNQSLSVSALGQASQLTDVAETIKLLVSPKECLLFLDLFVIYYYLIRNGEHQNYKYPIKNRNLKYGLVIMSIICIGMVLINPFDSDSIKGINRQEFFTYHIKDIYIAIARENTITAMADEITIDFDNVTTENGQLYGIAKDRNLIVIQVESLQNMAINRFYEGQELTPNLNRLIEEDTIYFNNYYQQLGRGNTSDAEFVSQNSLYAPVHGQAYDIYKDNFYYGLPWLMRDEGYETMALHGYGKEFWNRDTAYPGQGFETFISQEDYKIEEHIGFGLGDREFFEQSIDHLKKMEGPFYSFLITLSCHNPYDMPLKYQVIDLKGEDEGTLFGDYLQAVHYTDKAIGEFIGYLKDNDLYENSIIVVYGDHFGLNSKDESINENVSNFLGYDYDFDEMMKIPLIINIPGEDVHQTIETVGGQIDFLPTILNLMGIKNKNPLMFGQDILNAESGFVASQTYMLKGSFIQDDTMFEMSRDGVFKNSRAWNRITGEAVDIEHCREGYEKAIEEIDQSIYILENDLIRQVMNEENEYDGSEMIKDQIHPEKLISNAGGGIEELTSTNCKEALDKSYEDGYKFIKVAFDMGDNWHQMTLECLADWMIEHPEVYIITDVKGDNLELLSLISLDYPDIQKQIIPQIYFMDEYVSAEYLGYRNIIYALDRSSNTEEEIVDFAKHNHLLAVTMPIESAKTELPEKLGDIGVFTYSHTINDIDLVKVLEGWGVDGFYTDDLTTDDLIADENP